MITIYEDAALSFRVKWDQDSRFQVLQEYFDGASVEVDLFEVETSEALTMSEASVKAKEYCDMVRAEISPKWFV